eukprot:gene11199-7773_t
MGEPHRFHPDPLTRPPHVPHDPPPASPRRVAAPASASAAAVDGEADGTAGRQAFVSFGSGNSERHEKETERDDCCCCCCCVISPTAPDTDKAALFSPAAARLASQPRGQLLLPSAATTALLVSVLMLFCITAPHPPFNSPVEGAGTAPIPLFPCALKLRSIIEDDQLIVWRIYPEFFSSKKGFSSFSNKRTYYIYIYIFIYIYSAFIFWLFVSIGAPLDDWTANERQKKSTKINKKYNTTGTKQENSNLCYRMLFNETTKKRKQQQPNRDQLGFPPPPPHSDINRYNYHPTKIKNKNKNKNKNQ